MSQPGPSPRKSRRRRGLLLGGAALLLALIVLAVVFRTEIATRAAVAYLESRGLAVQALEVTTLTPDTLELRSVALGERRELAAAQIVLVPEIEAFDLGLAEVRIEGLRLTLDLTGEGPLFGSLQEAIDGLAGESGDGAETSGAGTSESRDLPSLPKVVLADAEATLQTRSGPLKATLAGALSTEAAELTLRLPGEAEHLDVRAKVRRSATAGGDEAVLSLQGELRTAGGLAPLLALPGPRITAGTLVFQAEGTASLPAEAATGDILQQVRVTLTGDVILAGAELADGTSGISAHLPLKAEVAEDRARFSLSDDAAVRVEQPSRERLRALGVPEDLLPLLVSGLNLTLAADGDLPFHLAMSPLWPPQRAELAVAARAASDQGLTLSLRSEGEARLHDGLALASFAGSLDGGAEAKSLSLGGREARGVALALPLEARYDAEGLRLALARPGSLRIAAFGATTPLQLQAPLAFAVDTLEVEAAPEDGSYRYRLGAREDGARFAIAAAGADPLAVTAGALAVTLDGSFDSQAGHAADLTARLGGLELPDYGFDAEVAEIDVTLDSALRPAQSRFTLGPFQLVADAPLTAPLTVSGTLQRAGSGYDLAGVLGLGGGQALVDLSGRYGDDGRASLEAMSRLIAFSPDGLQPAALSPLLADLEEAEGTVSATARLAWPRRPAEESGRITFGNLSFEAGGAAVEGLDLALELDSLLPLASAAGQRLTIARLEAGVAAESIELIFSLDQAPRPQLNLEDGGFELGGAPWRIEPTTLDPAAARNRIVLATKGLEIATFFDLIGVDGLFGSGRLTGSLPVVFAGNAIIVEESQFDALGPGRLSIRIPALRQALAGGGETVEAAVKALEDFHYEELTLTLAKTAENDATVKLSTLGQNPDVMDGQPFRFNINLESNLTSVLEALRQGYSLSDDALRRAWRLSE